MSDRDLRKIVDFLILNTSYSESLGLYHGKIGVALFFCEYSKYTKSKQYIDFAGELLQEVFEDIYKDIPIDMENGLSGIGFGIEYMVQQKYMDGDTGEILEDLDQLIMMVDPCQMTDHSFKTGLAGLAFYIACHYQSCTAHKLFVDRGFLQRLAIAVDRAIHTDGRMYFPEGLIKFYDSILKGDYERRIQPPLLFPSFLLNTPSAELSDSIGLHEGFACTAAKLIGL